MLKELCIKNLHLQSIKEPQSGAGIGNQSPQTKGKGNRARCGGVRSYLLPLGEECRWIENGGDLSIMSIIIAGD
jgi:hypothetical protein